MSLTGCARPGREVVVREVRVPITVPCAAKAPEAASYAADLVSLDESLFELVRALLIDREQRRAQELALRAAAEGCT